MANTRSYGSLIIAYLLCHHHCVTDWHDKIFYRVENEGEKMQHSNVLSGTERHMQMIATVAYIFTLHVYNTIVYCYSSTMQW